MKKERLMELAGVQLNESKNVLIQVDSESGTEVVSLDAADAAKIKELLMKAKGGDWPDEVNELLGKGKAVDTFATVNTMGDGWGWYQ